MIYFQQRLRGTIAEYAGPGPVAVPMPAGSYVGFAIGPESDWPYVQIDAGGTFTLPVGMIYPVKFSGQPRILLPNRSFGVTATLNVLGFTDPCELLVPAPRRAPAHWGQYSLSPGGTLEVPLGERRHARIWLYQNTTAGTFTVVGVTEDAQMAQLTKATLVSAQAITVSTDSVFHVGGTDNEEGFWALRVTLDSGGLTNFRVDAVGELGG